MADREPSSEDLRLLSSFGDLVQALDDADLSPAHRAALTRFGTTVDTFVLRRRMLLRRYQQLFDAAPDPYVVTNSAGILTEVNAAACALLRADADDLVGTALAAFVVESERERYAQWLEVLRSGMPSARWDTFFAVHDEPRPVPVEICLADDLEGIGYRWLLREQRERAAAERNLRTIAEQEHQAADQLRSEGRLKTDFLVSLSHDLRGPVGALIHQAELLTMDSISPEVRRRSRHAVQQNANLLSQILDALVDMERFALGELDLDPTPTTLADLADDLDRDPAQGSVDLHLDHPEVILDIDRSIVRRVIRTVIDTMRIRSEVTSIRLTVESDETSAVIHLDAKRDGDTAPSVSPEDRVGMRLARTLLDLHGGEIVTEASDGGHRVSLVLPRQSEDGPR